jgi:hypothetical protein
MEGSTWIADGVGNTQKIPVITELHVLKTIPIAYMVCVYSWHGLGSMPSAEAMRLFVKILEV